MDFIEIQLRDAESQEAFILKVSPADAIKAQNGKLEILDYSCSIFLIQLLHRF